VNLEGAFRADAERVRGTDVILVDDLVTTGATVRACAQALRFAGARRVVAVCAGYRDEKISAPGSLPQS
jgi:predicted amidophosphoribosyltransferase